MPYCLLFPAELLDLFDERNWSSGFLNLRIDDAQGVVTVAQAMNSRHEVQRLDGLWSETTHYLRFADVRAHTGAWYRADADLHLIHDQLLRRTEAAISLDYFRSFVKGEWTHPGELNMFVVTVTTSEGGGPAVSAWRINNEAATPESSSVVDGRIAPLEFIGDVWPVAELRACRATIVGVGSIGSAVAELLAQNGAGHLNLVDYDRLEQRNLPRHVLSERDLGRHKVYAMRDRLLDGRGGPSVDAFPIDVLTETDLLRPIVADSDIVICAADGVAPRRVCNHVCRRARTPLVLAAVLGDGAFGEVIRIRSRTGCLFCLRLALDETGAMNPEPSIDLGYGTGSTHRPMTASPGDLDLVAATAAKVAVSTLLERRGHWNQRLPGDFAILGLQPKPDYPAPFDITCAGDVRWHDLPAARSDCPTCLS